MTALTHAHPEGSCACGAGSTLAPLVGPLPAWSPPPPAPPRPLVVPTIADRILVGSFVTMDPIRPTADAVAVTDGHITALGTVDELEGLRGPGTDVTHVGDGVAYPGLVEPHMHYWASAMVLDWVDCSTREGATLDEILRRLAASPPVLGDWVLGRSFDPSLVGGERELTRDLLDAAVPDRPALVVNASLHFAYANSRALELAGLDDESPDPPGGFLGRADGRLTGLLGEAGAMGAALAVVPTGSPDRLLDALVRINHAAAAAGYTRTHDAATGIVLGHREVGLFHQVAERFAGRVGYAVADVAAEAAMANGLVPFAGDDRCRAVSWKLITDGSNQGRSGYQREPYLGRTERGHANLTLDELADRITLAHRSGWQVMAHANGDAAIDLVLDAQAIARDRGAGSTLRDRIEHCSFAHPEQLDRMAELGLSPSFLIGHLYYWGDAFEDRIVGADKASLLDPLGGATARGLRWTVHSDYTVTDMEPFRELQTAVTRVTRGDGRVLNAAERVGVAAALRAKTIDAAWQTHSDDVSGSLEVGKLADIVVLDRDPAEVPVDEIAGTTVVRTIVGGRTVFERG